MDLYSDALKILKGTSRTFYIPIIRLPLGLQEAVASAYLCFRAIDEIEDHPELDNPTKAKLLHAISLTLQEARVDGFSIDAFSMGFRPYEHLLPEVSTRIRDWTLLAPGTIAPRIWDAIAAMADRMAFWAEVNWKIETQSDLDRYTFSVAGAVGLLLSDLWAWYDGTQTNRTLAIGFGRGLQVVNMLRNHTEDLSRGVDFFPQGWSPEDMQKYARHNLSMADTYTNALPAGPALDFCQIPLTLAYGTLQALENGKDKLSRSDVVALIEPLIGMNMNAI
ncbi:phytoene/squalene synthase family protein [Aetokthonos hydrillicola Thurmond2011]|jgi:farnesyl-diphosphate farnesyltransferase|uniref:Phytoene/squalene synthase family protein n=1 Tax=Aetokthonos hydrillicola Thurmond2011 TaxID=2712845 RepID=A0AAP5I6Z0_9CYAN|nr:phytoene/squalene synthase family protein [Aetokthonos hydrillicola]MBO3461875.1 phytoene/squalene synthase family protein [Aetokthonos hydrillicola CCALA 1050]MBW4586783.1 phytoene/squalene synthase family protein [Aetokthonos hydrillicola CCALA 1050]MDR9895859.1 phytoene/squalene synthase family protein [Aetokthonos hydrillicola Thurmond2011]